MNPQKQTADNSKVSRGVNVREGRTLLGGPPPGIRVLARANPASESHAGWNRGKMRRNAAKAALREASQQASAGPCCRRAAERSARKKS
jgi:hypothetical protein